MNIEDVVGPIAEGGITDDQRSTLASAMLEAAVPKDDSLLARLVFKSKWFNDATAPDIASIRGIWTASAIRLKFEGEDGQSYAEWRSDKNNRPAGFAGDKFDGSLPSANTIFEVSYPAGFYPTVVPIRDNVDTNVVKVKNVVIHAIHKFCPMPFPESQEDGDQESQIINAADFLKNAAVVVTVEDALNNVYVFAGIVSYGTGGAMVWRVHNNQELGAALHGQGPSGKLSNLAQFAIGELAYLLSYYPDDYESLKAKLAEPEGETAWAE